MSKYLVGAALAALALGAAYYFGFVYSWNFSDTTAESEQRIAADEKIVAEESDVIAHVEEEKEQAGNPEVTHETKTGITQTVNEEETNGSAPEEHARVWTFTDVTAGADIARTEVSVTFNGKTHRVGTFDGSCVDIKASSWTLLEGELEGVICWWAGGGSEIGIFGEGGAFVVKVGQIEEGTEETQGFRGNFETLLSL